jgi:isopenicillin N synthase-like dioxygenase
MDDFFALPMEAKNEYRVAGANRGYSPPKSESLSLSLGVESATRMNDFFEAFNIGIEARSFGVGGAQRGERLLLDRSERRRIVLSHRREVTDST